MLDFRIAIILLIIDVIAGFLSCFFLTRVSFLIIIFAVIIFYSLLGYIFNFLLNRQEKKMFSLLVNDVIENTYNFCNIGLILINNDKEIIWFNDEFKKFDEEKFILNKNIFTFFVDLQKIFLNDYKECVIRILEKCYKVKYFKDIKLFVFYDISTIDNLKKQIEDSELVLGIIKIDNYEIVLNNDYEENSIEIKRLIMNYFKGKKALVCPFKSDSYLFICNFKIYKKNILNDIEKGIFIAQEEKNDEYDTTFSVGISFNSSDIDKLSLFANKAMIYASERGGNQIAVYDCYYEDKITFFSNNRIKKNYKNHDNLRFYGRKILELIKNSDSIFVVGHINGDVDSIASCFGIYAICEAFRKKCFIICDVDLLEKKAKNAVKTLFPNVIDIFLKKSDIKNKVNSNDLLIVVDHNSLINSDIKGVEKKFSECKVIILDHHRRSNKIFENIFYYIDVNVSSTAEIISRIISISRIKIDGNIATILLSGIFFDSLFLRSNRANFNTFQVIEFLINNSADKTLACDLLKDDLNETKEIISSIINDRKNIKICDGIYCYVENGKCQRSFLAKIANMIVGIKNIEISFSAGKIDDNNIYVSCRSNGIENVQSIAEKMGGGGHSDSAAFSSCEKTIYEILEKLFHVLMFDFGKNVNICPVCFHELEKNVNDYNGEYIFCCKNKECKYVTYFSDDKNSSNKKYTTFKNFKNDDFFINNIALYNWVNSHTYKK